MHYVRAGLEIEMVVEVVENWFVSWSEPLYVPVM